MPAVSSSACAKGAGIVLVKPAALLLLIFKDERAVIVEIKSPAKAPPGAATLAIISTVLPCGIGPVSTVLSISVSVSNVTPSAA